MEKYHYKEHFLNTFLATLGTIVFFLKLKTYIKRTIIHILIILFY